MRRIFITGLAVVVLAVAALPALGVVAGGNGIGTSVASAAQNFSGYDFSAQAQYKKKNKKCKGQGDGGPRCQKKGGKKGGDGRGGKGDGGPRRQ